VSDPNKPVPYRAKIGQTIDGDYMTDDQRFATRRPDVVVYTTPDIDGDVTLAGPIDVDLWVTTTGTDADFVVKLVDIYPADHAELPGYQQLVRAEIMRGKFRTGFDNPQPFKPGEPTEVRFKLPDVFHTFRKGHHLMVQVQSSWFPLVDRNPQTFVDIYKATDADFHAATHRILRAPGKASSIRVLLQHGAL
jgi:putative CocE/NonD family hydrolase